jgi:Ulp1 family protease
VPDVHIFDPFLYTYITDQRGKLKKPWGKRLARWDKEADHGYEPLDTSKLMFPINVRGNHWVLCAVSMRTRTVTLYDSLSRCANDDDEYTHAKLMGNVLSYVLHRAECIRPAMVSLASDWTQQVAKVPQQRNGCDCGVYALAFLIGHSTYDNDAYEFANHIPAYRKKLAAWVVRMARPKVVR